MSNTALWILFWVIILSPLWAYIVPRLISAACFKSWSRATKNRKQEEENDGTEK